MLRKRNTTPLCTHIGYFSDPPAMNGDKPEPLDTTAHVESPEHIRFHYHVAGPVKRGLACFLDTLVQAGILLIFGIVVGIAGLSADELSGLSLGLYQLIVFVVIWFYYVIFEVLWSGRTPGKRALRLRVVTEGGHPLNFANSMLRNLLRAADFLPLGYAIGFVVMSRDARFRRLGDLVAGTMVIVDDRHLVEGPLRIEPPPVHWELAQLPEHVHMTGDDLEAIELFLRRCFRLSPARQFELAQMVAPIYAQRMALPMPTNPHRFLALVYFKARGGKT